MSKRLVVCLAYPILLLVTACQGYDFTFNDKVVYRTAPLLADFTVGDVALRTCLEQAIADDSITAYEQLEALNCSNAGIVDLGGLASFVNLKTVRLSSNHVRNLVELGTLKALEYLYMDDNQIVDPVPLYHLATLRHVDLTGNDLLQCPKQGSFAQVETVILPQHCR